jgi:hypothetical protein
MLFKAINIKHLPAGMTANRKHSKRIINFISFGLVRRLAFGQTK